MTGSLTMLMNRWKASDGFRGNPTFLEDCGKPPGSLLRVSSKPVLVHAWPARAIGSSGSRGRSFGIGKAD